MNKNYHEPTSYLFGSSELLHLRKTFMKMFNNAKDRIDKKGDKFREEINLEFEELVELQ